MTSIIGSKWTAMQRTFGWRHFQVAQKRKDAKEVFVLLVATCDGSVQLWVNAKTLRDRASWAAGHLQRAQLQSQDDARAGSQM
ncbi:hypothetical protein WJX72_008221 [[Myrmecia] bisecta]|uniref:Uncharacterized protein n=1 Tax=[Myrmecia] bisecta TaxID=41462 RepID=A0AAW1P7P3_9CHLO